MELWYAIIFGVSMAFLVIINGVMAFIHYKANYQAKNSLVDYIRIISDVIRTADSIVSETDVDKVGIVKINYKDVNPHFEVVYDNNISGESNYTAKYARMPIDNHLINDAKSASNGEVVKSLTSEMPDSIRKSAYQHEGVVYSEFSKLVENDDGIVVLSLHYRGERDDKYDNVIQPKLKKLVKLFQQNNRII